MNALILLARSAALSQRTGPAFLILAGLLGLVAFLVLPAVTAGSHTRTVLQIAAGGDDGTGSLWLFALCWLVCLLVGVRGGQTRMAPTPAAMERALLAGWLCSACLALGVAMSFMAPADVGVDGPGGRVMLLAAALGAVGAWQTAWIAYQRSRAEAIAGERALRTPLVVRIAVALRSWRADRPRTGSRRLSLAGLAKHLFGTPRDETSDAEGMPQALVVPATRLQAALMRRFPVRYIANGWIMAAVGALAALVLGIALTVVIQPLWQGAVGTALDLLAATGPRGLYASSLAQVVLAPDPIALFAFEQHIDVVARGAVGSTGVVPGSLTLTLPICALLAIPAFSLAVGGYLSAASVFGTPVGDGVGRRLSACIARGALIGPFYALLMLATAALALHSVHAQVPGLSGRLTVGPSLSQSIAYGLLWGVLFGALGGWLQWTGRGALPVLRAKVRAASVSRVVSSGAGALAAAVGMLLSFAFIALAATIYVLTQTSMPSPAGGGPGSAIAQALAAQNAPTVVFLALVLTPVIAIYAVAFFTGAPLDLDAYGQPATTLRLPHSASLVAPELLALLCLIPVIWSFVGGRVAARLARARTGEEAAAAGASIALPLGLLLGTLSVLVSFALDIAFAVPSSARAVSTIGVHLSVFDTFASVCVVSLLCGAAGGASVIALPDLGRRLARTFRPVQQVEVRFFPLLDRIAAPPGGSAPSPSRQWLYTAVLVAVELCALVLVLDMASVVLAPIVPVAALSAVQSGVVTLLFMLPLICLLAALALALRGHVSSGVLEVPAAARRWSSAPPAARSRADQAAVMEESGEP